MATSNPVFLEVQAPYDVNFCFPVKDLDTARVKLVPFVPSQHAQGFFDGSQSDPGLYRYLPFGPFPTIADFLEWQESRIRTDGTNVLFAVIDKTRSPDQASLPGALAGIIGLLGTSPPHASTELGFVITLPDFQRTHVTKNAVGLLLHYCLDLPEDGGLGLRRVQWQAHSENLASIRAAEKMGFVKEGIIRWQRVLPPVKEGKRSRQGDPIDAPGRDSVLLAICWDDWETGKAKIDALMHQVILK